MKKAIVITSIFHPTEAVEKFSKMKDYELIVVGDKKTPEDWKCKDAVFFSINDKRTNNFFLNSVLPYNHYCRKMLGYLYAIQNDVDAIVDTDDDNIPKNNWSFPSFEGNFDCIKEGRGFVNIYNYFTEKHIWPRGLPLKQILQRDSFDDMIKKEVKIGVWQGLADEDPDVDAIYRLTSDDPCYFEEREPVVLGKDTLTPFNTQNTIIRKELFPLMYLPTYVTFRFTDILRGLIAQPIMWLYGYHLGFINATVIQKRNPHDYFKDFISELPMYQNSEHVIDIVRSTISPSESVKNNLHIAYAALKKEGIIDDREMLTLDAWLKDLDKLSN